MKMKYKLTIGLAFGLSSLAFSQNVGINGTGAAPNASAMLDVVATDKGVLVPRVALTATNATGPVTAPATSLLVYNTATAGAGATAVSPGFYYWDGAQWVRFMNGNGTAWNTLGNAATVAATNFVGTTDNIALRFRTNNTERFEMTIDGRLRSFNLGTAALPTYTWNGDPNTGIFSSGADQVDFSTNGTARFRVPNADQVHALSGGTFALPFYSFDSDPGTGMMNFVGNLGISTSGILAAYYGTDQSYIQETTSTTVDATTIYCPIGTTSGYGAIFGSNSDPGANGTGYGSANSNYGILGSVGGTRTYSFGVSGQSDDNNRNGGVLGMSPNTTRWGVLGYRTSGGVQAAVYGSAAYSSGGGFSSNRIVSGLAYLGYSDFVGSIIHSEIVGQVSVGKLMASYNIGNEFTSGYSADVITLNNGERQIAYSNTSTELKIYDDGLSNLIEGKKFISFDSVYKNSLKEGTIPTITVSPMGECNGIFVLEVTKEGFWVKEMMNGNSAVSFSWIAIGKRNDEIDTPNDILDSNFNKNISNVAPNENDPNTVGNTVYWNGEKFVFGEDVPEIKEELKFKKKESKTLKEQLEIIKP